jgi:hypothetical protein
MPVGRRTAGEGAAGLSDSVEPSNSVVGEAPTTAGEAPALPRASTESFEKLLRMFIG